MQLEIVPAAYGARRHPSDRKQLAARASTCELAEQSVAVWVRIFVHSILGDLPGRFNPRVRGAISLLWNVLGDEVRESRLIVSVMQSSPPLGQVDTDVACTSLSVIFM